MKKPRRNCGLFHVPRCGARWLDWRIPEFRHRVGNSSSKPPSFFPASLFTAHSSAGRWSIGCAGGGPSGRSWTCKPRRQRSNAVRRKLLRSPKWRETCAQVKPVPGAFEVEHIVSGAEWCQTTTDVVYHLKRPSFWATATSVFDHNGRDYLRPKLPGPDLLTSAKPN